VRLIDDDDDDILVFSVTAVIHRPRVPLHDGARSQLTLWQLELSSAVRIFEILNPIVTSVFDSKRAQLFKLFECLPSPISYLFNRMTPIFHLSNQQNPQTWSRRCRLKTLSVV